MGLLKLKKNQKPRIFILILIVTLFSVNSFSQIDPMGGVARNYLQNQIKLLYTFEKLKSMTTLEGTRAVNTAYINAQRKINTHYDIQVQNAKRQYSLSIKGINPNTQEGELYQARRYKIYMEQISRIELQRNKSLNIVRQQNDELKKSFSIFWSKNDFNNKMKFSQ